MLDQLVESKNHNHENTRRSGFLFMTLGVLVAVLLSGWTYSLFAKNYAMSGDFEMSNLVAPVAPVTDAPPPPKPDLKPETTQAVKSDKIILRELYDDLSSPKIPPKDTRGEKDVVSATKFDLSKVERGNFNQIPTNVGRGDSNPGTNDCGLCEQTAEKKNDKPDEDTPKVVVKPSPSPTVNKPQPPKSLGVVNGIATSLVKPAYPAAAKSVRIEGIVQVQVLIDEKGNVVSASAANGHPLLRGAAVQAAKQSKFTPTTLSGQAVKVTGIIVYNFTL